MRVDANNARFGRTGNHPCIVQWEPFNEGDMFDLFNNSGNRYNTMG